MREEDGDARRRHGPSATPPAQHKNTQHLFLTHVGGIKARTAMVITGGRKAQGSYSTPQHARPGLHARPPPLWLPLAPSIAQLDPTDVPPGATGAELIKGRRTYVQSTPGGGGKRYFFFLMLKQRGCGESCRSGAKDMCGGDAAEAATSSEPRRAGLRAFFPSRQIRFCPDYHLACAQN